MWIGLFFAYSLMGFAQLRGGVLISFLHGKAVAQRAMDEMHYSSSSVQPDLSYRQLCAGYVEAHHNASSNVLHAVGMLTALIWFFLTTYRVVAFCGIQRTTNKAYTKTLPGKLSPLTVAAYLCLPPLYYLPAWVGHFWFQQDIPAVFTYGTTFLGWLKGELCSWEDLALGGTIRSPTEIISSLALTCLVIRSLSSLNGGSRTNTVQSKASSSNKNE